MINHQQIRTNSGADSLGLRSLLGNIAPSLPPSTLSPSISLAAPVGSASSTFSTSGVTFSTSGVGGHLGLGGLGSVGGVTGPPPGLGGPGKEQSLQV